MTTDTIGNRTGTTIGTAAEDAKLVSGFPTTNFSGDAGSGTGPFLIRFAGLSSITGPVTVSDAFFTMYVVVGGSAGDIDIVRVRRNWVEAQATWNVYSTGNSWTTAGGTDTTNDVFATASARIAYTGGFATGDFNSTLNTTLIADVEGIINGTISPNCGWRFPAGPVSFSLPAEGTASRRPMLTVTYTASGGGGLRRKGSLSLLGVGRIDNGAQDVWQSEPGSHVLLRDRRPRVAYSIPYRKAA